jgi:putative CocE/NonD family hydrolase
MNVIVELDVPAQMRDGVLLRANVYRPDAAGRWPTLLHRRPYGKDVGSIYAQLDPVQVARSGFVVIVQDCRGRFASEGDFEPFRYEGVDGFDTVEWAARLPYSSGRVGMYGGSYSANAVWLAAIEQPPSLHAIAPGTTWSEPMDGLYARGGAVELGLSVQWSLEHGLADLNRRFVGPELESRRNQAITDYDRVAVDGYWGVPVTDLPVYRRNSVPEFGAIRVIDEPAIAAYPRVAGHGEEIAISSFITTGWYDLFVQGALDNYVMMAANGQAPRLVIGPWTHMEFADPVGDQLFGRQAGRYGGRSTEFGNIRSFELAWFAHHLSPTNQDDFGGAQVRIFVMGRNEWRDESEWPLSRAVPQRWFLRSGGGLTPTEPDADDSSTEFSYNPLDPVLSHGGAFRLSPAFRSGPLDQGCVEARDDVLVFTSDPLDEDKEVTGRIRMVLYGESSAPSTDWVARLCDVDPDGRSINLCDGIVRVTSGLNAVARYDIDLWSISNVFLPGHRLRIQITSSSFPRWDRNLNTGNQRGNQLESARQRVHHASDRASYVELPVVE